MNDIKKNTKSNIYVHTEKIKQLYTYFKGEICVKWNIGNLSFNLFSLFKHC